jgi:hypothetical protein
MKRLYLALINLFLINTVNAQWEQTNGLTGVDIKTNCLAANGSNIFAGTGTGVYLSTNNGNNWTAVNNGLTDTYISSLGITGNNIFAGTFSGIFLSTNNGGLWTPINTGLPPNYTTLAFAFNDTNVFAATPKGVFLSSNKGGNWKEVSTGLPKNTYGNINITSLAANGNYIFAGLAEGLYISNNNGSNWMAVGNTGLQNTMSVVFRDNYIFAGTWGSGVFISTNNGSNWSAVNGGLTDLNVQSLNIKGSSIFTGTLGGAGVSLSTNNGSSWALMNTGLSNRYVHTLVISGNYLFAGTSGGVYKFLLSGSTGFDDKMDNKKTMVFPNPNTGKFTLWIDSTPVEDLTLKLLNTVGQVVEVRTVKPASINQTELFDVSYLSKGIYHLVITSDKFQKSEKIVVQ